MNAPAQDIRDGGVWGGTSWQRDVLREKGDISNLAALPAELPMNSSEKVKTDAERVKLFPLLLSTKIPFLKSSRQLPTTDSAHITRIWYN